MLLLLCVVGLCLWGVFFTLWAVGLREQALLRHELGRARAELAAAQRETAVHDARLDSCWEGNASMWIAIEGLAYREDGCAEIVEAFKALEVP